MGDLVDLESVRRRRTATCRLVEVPASDGPTPQELGWSVFERDGAGRPIRWLHLPYQALIGIDVASGRVYLDRDRRLLAWDELTIEELVLGVETGFLPDPDLTLSALPDPE